MALQTKSLDYRLQYPEMNRLLRFRISDLHIRGSVILLVFFWLLFFLSALYYVEQQVRLQSLNYSIIELKKQHKVLLEQHKTYQLQLHQSKRLDRIEREMSKRGFVPVEEHQIRVVP